MKEKWQSAIATYKNPLPQELASMAAGMAMDKFLQHEDGRLAQELLRVSKREIVLAEDEEGGAHCGAKYVFDGNGLGIVLVPTGTWAAYDEKEAKRLAADRKELNPHDAGKAAIDPRIGKCKTPLEFIPWLIRELDKVADTAPKA